MTPLLREVPARLVRADNRDGPAALRASLALGVAGIAKWVMRETREIQQWRRMGWVSAARNDCGEMRD